MRALSGEHDSLDRELSSSPSVLLFKDEVKHIANSILGDVIFVTIAFPWDDDSAEHLVGIFGGSASALSCVIMLATGFPARVDALRSLQKRLEQLSGFKLPDPQHIPIDKSTINIIPIEALVTQGALIVSLSRQLSQLRRKNEQLQNSLLDVESFLDRMRIQPHEKLFEASPAKMVMPNALELSPGVSVGQIIPESSRGVVAISLYIFDSGSSESNLHLTLRTLEDNAVVGSWSVRGDRLKQGWNKFGLKRSLGGLRRTLRLEAELTGEGQPPTLSLSDLQPIRRYRPTNILNGEQIAARHLAFQIWAGLPNLLIPDWRSVPSTRGLREFVLADDVLGTAQTPALAGGDSRRSRTAIRRANLTLSWEGRLDASVRLPQVLPIGTVRVSAGLFVPSSNRASILFKAQALSSDGRVWQNDSARGDHIDLGATDWINVAPGELGRLDLLLSDLAPLQSDIVFYTRASRLEEGPYEVILRSITAMVDYDAAR